MRTIGYGSLMVSALLLVASCGGGQVQPECPDPSVDEAAPVALDMTKKLTGVTEIEAAVAVVTEALKTQGFGVVSDMDVQAVMQEKLDKDLRPYRILGACNPALAMRALEHDKAAGLLLPCKAVVYQDEDGAFVVTLGRPTAVFSLLGDPATDPLAEEVEQKLRAVFDSL